MNVAIGSSVFVFAMSLGWLIPGCSSGGVSYVPVRASAGPVASADPNAATTPPPNPNATPTPTAGGVVVIAVPSPAPLLCSPTPVIVPVAQTAVISCTSPGYSGPFAISLSDPTVASVELAAGTLNFFYIDGLKPGMTTLLLQYSVTGSGSVSITVP